MKSIFLINPFTAVIFCVTLLYMIFWRPYTLFFLYLNDLCHTPYRSWFYQYDVYSVHCSSPTLVLNAILKNREKVHWGRV